MRKYAFAPAALAVIAATPAAAQDTAIGFAVVGDTGYIPSYEEFDEEETPMETLGAYLALEQEEWLERNPDMEGFRPTPWIFETARGGYVAQSGMYPVARGTAEVCARHGCNFATMVGDNIYPDGATLGADGIDDERRFAEMLDAPFGSLGAGTPGFTIYGMMGNHDWRISRAATGAQRDYFQRHPNFAMPDYFYRVVPEGLEGEVELFVIDTEMLLASTTVYDDQLDELGNPVETTELDDYPPWAAPQTEGERNMVAWLEDALASSTARWKIVAGHHALWSSGGTKFRKAEALRALYLPALCRYADLYISGDDHLTEAYTDDCSVVESAAPGPLPLVVAGAGSKYRPQHRLFAQTQLRDNPQIRHLFGRGNDWGFAHVSMQGDQLTARLYTTGPDIEGRPVEEAEFTFDRRSNAAGRASPAP